MSDLVSHPVSQPACLIGVDIGTTEIKAGAFNEKGHVLVMASAELRIDRPKPGWATFDAVNIWQQTMRVLVEISRAIKGRFEAQAIGVSSMAETSIPLDAHGEPCIPQLLGLTRGPPSRPNGGPLLWARSLFLSGRDCPFSPCLV